MATWRELDESAVPEGLIAERLGVEAGGQLAVVAEPHADAFGNRHARAAEDAAQDRAQVGLVPAAVGPGVFVLVAPVPRLAAIEPGERGQERERSLLLYEIRGFLGVEIVDAIAIDRVLPVRPLLGWSGARSNDKLGHGRANAACNVLGRSACRAGPDRTGTGPGRGARPATSRPPARRASACHPGESLRYRSRRPGIARRRPGRGTRVVRRVSPSL